EQLGVAPREPLRLRSVDVVADRALRDPDRCRDLSLRPTALESQSKNFSNLPHRMALHGALRPPLGRPERSSRPPTPSPTAHAARPACGARPRYPTPCSSAPESVLTCAGTRAQVCRNDRSGPPERCSGPGGEQACSWVTPLTEDMGDRSPVDMGDTKSVFDVL